MWFDAARHDSFLDGFEDEVARVADATRELAEAEPAAAVEAIWLDVKRCVEDLVASLGAAEALRYALVPYDASDVDEDARVTLVQLAGVLAAFRRRNEAFESPLTQETITEEATLREALLREAEAAAHEAAAAGTMRHLDVLAEPAWRQLMESSREILARLVLVEARGVSLDPEALAVALARRSEKMLVDARTLWDAGSEAAAA